MGCGGGVVEVVVPGTRHTLITHLQLSLLRVTPSVSNKVGRYSV